LGSCISTAFLAKKWLIFFILVLISDSQGRSAFVAVVSIKTKLKGHLQRQNSSLIVARYFFDAMFFNRLSKILGSSPCYGPVVTPFHRHCTTHHHYHTVLYKIEFPTW